MPEAEKTFARLDRMLASERPDLVVFTGDVVTGSPAEGMWRRLLDTMTARKVPFCVVLGNHDSEQDISRQQIGRIVTSYPGSLNTLDAAGELADRELEIFGSGSQRPALLLYCLDSHSESLLDGIDGYDWFRPEQVEWLRGRCTARRTRQRRPCGAFAGIFPHRVAGIPRGVAQSFEQPYRTGRRGRVSG